MKLNINGKDYLDLIEITFRGPYDSSYYKIDLLELCCMAYEYDFREEVWVVLDKTATFEEAYNAIQERIKWELGETN